MSPNQWRWIIFFNDFILFISFNSHSSDKPVDIWNLNEKKNDQNSEPNLPIDKINDPSKETSIYNKKSNDETFEIVQDTFLNSKKIRIPEILIDIKNDVRIASKNKSKFLISFLLNYFLHKSD